MSTIAALIGRILAAANSDPIVLALPAFVTLIVIGSAARVLRGRYFGVIAALCRACFQARWFPAVLAILAFLVTALLAGLASERRVDLQADMRISAGQFAEARVNDPNLPPLRLPVVPNERRVYCFEGIPVSLKYLRFDPTENPSATINLYSVSIVSGGRVLRWFGPGDLRAWRVINMEASRNGGGLGLLSTTDDPILETKLSFVASRYPAWLEYTLEVFRRPHFYTLGVMLWFLFFLLAGVGKQRGAIEAALVAVVATVAYPVAIAIRHVPLTAPAVESAVGNASYAGYPKLQDFLISFGLFGVSLVVAWLAMRFIPATEDARIPEEPAIRKPRARWLSRLPSAAVCLALVSLYIPDLSGALDKLRQTTFRPLDFDGQNSLLWAYLVSHGYLPFRDFWYPYAGFFVHLFPFPVGTLLGAAEYTLTLWFLYLALRHVFPHSRRAWVSLFLLMLVPVLHYEFVGWFRYLLGVNVAVLYVALQATPKTDRRMRVWFAALVGFAFWYEPAQLIYAGAGILTHIGFATWAERGTWTNWRSAVTQVGRAVRPRAIAVAVPALIGVLPILLLLIAAGMLPGFVGFHLTLSDQSVYGALPADVDAWTLPALRFETVFLLLFFTLVLAFYGWFRERRRPDGASVALLVVSLAGLMAMQKQLVRSHNMHVVQVYPFLAALLYAACAWPRRTRGQALVVAAFLGYAAGVAQHQGIPSQLYRSALSTPARLAGDFGVFWSRLPEVRQVGASQYDISRFGEFVPENAVLRILTREFGWTESQKLYVLGDDSVFYILAGQKPPYVANNYNCSPLVEQNKVLAWLQSQRPRFVVWNPAKASFDGVPHVVRLPLIYQYVVEHYRPLRAVGPYQVLIASADPAETDLPYWLSALGNRVDLGHIPELASAGAYQDCPANARGRCGTVLYIRLSTAAPAGKAVATIESSAGPIEVQFDLSPDCRNYMIDLDRTWFRRFLGAEARVDLPIPGSNVNQEQRLRMSNVLY